jgi:hypothetical protein
MPFSRLSKYLPVKLLSRPPARVESPFPAEADAGGGKPLPGPRDSCFKVTVLACVPAGNNGAVDVVAEFLSCPEMTGHSLYKVSRGRGVEVSRGTIY